MNNLITVREDTRVMTERDIYIAQSLADGLTVTQIAEASVTNVRTMEARVGRLRLKTGSKSLCNLVALFFRAGLIK